jgi:hypothetical protein
MKTEDEADDDLSMMAFKRDQARQNLDRANRRLSNQATQLRQAFSKRDSARRVVQVQGTFLCPFFGELSCLDLCMSSP